MFRIRILPAVTFLFLLGALLSCTTPFKQGLKSYENIEFHKAIGHFEDALKKGGDKAKTNQFIAESYRRSNRIREAEPYYKAALDANSSDDEVRFYYAMALKANGKYDEAKQRFELYSTSGGNTDLIRRAKNELQNFDKIKEILSKKTYFEVENCQALNTEVAEYGPVVYNNQLVFTSARKDETYLGTGAKKEGIYVYEFNNLDQCQGSARMFDANLNLSNANEGTPAFAHDGSFMIFARSGTGEKGDANDVHLYISRRAEDGWSEPEILPYPINISQSLYEAGNQELQGSKGDYWSAQPAISPDGKRLYFVSDRPGGSGKLDVWRADINSGGRISNIRNVGSSLNTLGNEMFPYVSEAGVLYFASDGHPGIGGLDIFEAVRVGGKTTIKNLGVPINSFGDDFGLVFRDDTTGYFTSNREGGKGNDDIYVFHDVTPDKKIVRYNLVINVLGFDKSKPDQGEYPLSSAKVGFYKGDELHKGQKLHDFETSTQGKTPVFPLTDIRADYTIYADAGEEYLTKEVDYTLVGSFIPQEILDQMEEHEIDTTYEVDVVLEKIIVSETLDYDTTYVTKLEINFGFNKYDIRPDAAVELDKFVVFLKDNPQIIIELSSHTDAVGTDSNNEVLSQNRAESTRAYLVDKGIEPNRIVAKGYGERYLKIKTEDAEERNRRTEFRIIGIARKRR